MSSGLDNESTRNKLKELALYDSETNETDLMKTQCVLFWCNSNGHYDASHGWIWSNTWNPKQWERRRKKHPDYCKEAKENVRGAIKTTDKDIAKTALLAKEFREAERVEAEDLFIALIYYGTSLLFIVIGNYLPKIKQNNKIGIIIVLTLQDEENWNATHSFSGRIWGTSGILCMLCTLYLIKSVSKEACIKAK